MRKASVGLTLIELLVVIAVIAALAAILYPVIYGARKRGQNAQIVSNMRQLAQAVNVYMEDNHLRLPPFDPRPLLKNPAVRAIAYYPHKMATRTEMDNAPREEVPFLGDYVYCRQVVGVSANYFVADSPGVLWRDPDSVWRNYWKDIPAAPVILVSLHDAGFQMLPRQRPLGDAVPDTEHDKPVRPPPVNFPPKVLRCRLDTSVRTYRIVEHMQTNMGFSYIPLCMNKYACCKNCQEAGQDCSE
ncbi:MAG: prepilin-type N-terminal cleavage/methylation domain-containing protein [Fimbriimonadia bacterium]|jgi:prepilin-type N-terminal cleavage/methylation domain-containing protein